MKTLYTSNNLSSLYLINNEDFTSVNDKITFYFKCISASRTEKYKNGIIGKNKLQISDLYVLDILLSFKTMVDDSKQWIQIYFKDIDMMRGLNLKNRPSLELTHKRYITSFERLHETLWVCVDENSELVISDLSNDNRILEYSYIYKNNTDKIIGIKYSLNIFGDKLVNLNQRYTMEYNFLNCKFNELLYYQIQRYLLCSIYMNKNKSNSIVRGLKSILKNTMVIGKNNESIGVNYYDYLLNIEPRKFKKVLVEFMGKVKKVLENLEKYNVIESYSFEEANSRFELINDTGKVILATLKSKK